MGLGWTEMNEVPEETARVARAAFRKGNVYMRMRDELGVIFSSADWKDLYKGGGRPAIAPGMLALVTVMQYSEGMSDRQAADAVRGRIDWKYALGLSLTDEGFDHTALTEFRSRVIAQEAEGRLLTLMLDRLKEMGLLEGKRMQRTDSTQILAAIRDVNRLELVAATMQHTLGVLLTASPVWTEDRMEPHWVQRYATRMEDYRLPKKAAEREALAVEIGQDGLRLLELIWTDEQAPSGIAAVDTLRRIWEQQFRLHGDRLRWRRQDELVPAQEQIASPFDVDARWSYKRSKTWTGYKIHVTETCGAAAPNLILHVETTPATTPDVSVLRDIQTDLQAGGVGKVV